PEPLATLVQYDPERAQGFITSELCRQLRSEPRRGYSAPKIVATVFDLVGEDAKLGLVFEDFLQHIQELFKQMPEDRWFDTLRNWRDQNEQEEIQICNLLIDRLAEPGIDFGQRLMAAICELLQTRGGILMSVIVQRLPTVNGLQFWRILIIIVA